MDEGRQRKVVSIREWMWTRDAREWRHQSGVDAVGDVLEVFGGWREGRQRKVASVRAGTPSGDTTRTP